MFDFKLIGVDSISKEYKDFMVQVNRAKQAGLTVVGSELTKQLQRHIQQDVYAVYEPQAYIRRGADGGIISTDFMYAQKDSNSLTFIYQPKGYNPRYPTSKYVDGDKLINAIENSNYTWSGTDDIPKRPFWNMFVDEAMDPHGWVEKLFVRSMNQAEPTLQVKRDGRIERDSNDTIFEQQLSFNDIHGSSSDDDLPF